jgi:hypothetical protein
LSRDKHDYNIRSNDAVFLRLHLLYDRKWEKYPDDSGSREMWLEVCRIVADGSTYPRDKSMYAETPDMSLVLMFTSMMTSLKYFIFVGDVARAYLNAPTIEENIVLVTPPERTLLLKVVRSLSRGGSMRNALRWVTGSSR